MDALMFATIDLALVSIGSIWAVSLVSAWFNA